MERRPGTPMHERKTDEPIPLDAPVETPEADPRTFGAPDTSSSTPSGMDEAERWGVSGSDVATERDGDGMGTMGDAPMRSSRRSTTMRRPAGKKSAAKPRGRKKSAAKKPTAKRSAGKTAAKASSAKKTTAKRGAAKKTAAKRGAAKKTTAKRGAAKKTTAKRTTVKKSAAKRKGAGRKKR